MPVAMTCACGKQIPVPEGTAGGRVQCSCGKTVNVPGLTELRLRAGLRPVRISIAARIEEMVMAGDLPHGTHCFRCGQTTGEILQVVAACECVWITTEVTMISEKEIARHGRELIVPVPVRLCPACRQAVFRKERGKRVLVAAASLGVLGLVLLLLGLFVAGIFALVLAVLIFVEALWAERRMVALLKKLLLQEPFYKQLLTEYPDTLLSYVKE